MTDRTLIPTLLLLWAMCIALLGWTLPAHAHSWYSYECCSGNDCMPIDAPARVKGGWHVKGIYKGLLVDEIVGDDAATVRQSQDGNFHICVKFLSATTGGVRCLYVPEFGS